MSNLAFYIPFHYPSRKEFFALLNVLEQHGAAYVEIGIPVQNPFMDGALIKETHQEVLKQLPTHDSLIQTLKEIKEKFTFKVVLMTYKEGFDTFSLNMIPTSLYDGLLCVDQVLNKDTFHHPIQIYPPHLKEEEIISLLQNNELFAYVISGEGKTGSFNEVPTQYKDSIHFIKKHSPLPIFVGFGIKTPEDVASIVKNGADGAIIGTEFLRRFQQGGINGVHTYLDGFDSIMNS